MHAAEVCGIRLDPYGFVMVKPDMGLVRGLVNEPVAKICPVEDGQIHFGDLRLQKRGRGRWIAFGCAARQRSGSWATRGPSRWASRGSSATRM